MFILSAQILQQHNQRSLQMWDIHKQTVSKVHDITLRIEEQKMV